MSGLSGKDFRALANLLNEGESSSSEDDLPNPGLSKRGPGDIQVTSKKTTSVKGNVKGATGDSRIPTDPDDIWDVNDVESVTSSDDVIADPRDRPPVDIVYKQKVGSEDIFLQMTRKTPMTSSCELMVVTVTMKYENKSQIDCNITESELDIRSPLYRLHLAFPHHVDPDKATAEWDPSNFQLVITLEIVRELDAINF